MNEPLTDEEFEKFKDWFFKGLPKRTSQGFQSASHEILWLKAKLAQFLKKTPFLIATVESLKDINFILEQSATTAISAMKCAEHNLAVREKENARLKAELHKLEDENDKLTGVIGKPFTDMDRQ